MMIQEFEQLFDAYIAELRESKDLAELWWSSLNEQELRQPGSSETLSVRDRWPLGPASHPFVIATYRKYYFLCKALNETLAEHPREVIRKDPSEDDWGQRNDEPPPARQIEPKVFVLDLLAGGRSDDLYQFMLSLVYVPIGMKNSEPV